MRRVVVFAVTLLVIFLSLTVQAQSPPAMCGPGGAACVPPGDMAVFMTALREKKCLMTTTPDLTSDPIQVIIDNQGRVFASGSDPRPFTLHLAWCGYKLDAVGQVQVTAGQEIPSTYGFRFRPKAAIGLLGTELLTGSRFEDSVDAGVLVEPFYFLTHFNIDGYVGVRSVGGGLGFDLTRNVGVFAGYATTWSQFRGNPMIALYFSLW